jgi:hypothetical protein
MYHATETPRNQLFFFYFRRHNLENPVRFIDALVEAVAL